jgi:hypothetical protein
MQITLLIALVFSFSLSALAIVMGHPESEVTHPQQIRLILIPNSNSEPAPALSSFSRCSGVAISDHEVLTAGHCVIDGAEPRRPTVARFKKNKLETISPLNVITDYVSEVAPIQIQEGPVPGCSSHPRNFFESETLDIAIIIFPSHSFSDYLEIDTNTRLRPGDTVTYFGFGSKENSFISQILMPRISPNDLRSMTTRVSRSQNHSQASISTPLDPIADEGDSGGAVVHNNKVVGILNTVEEKCETELGQDFGYFNSFTNLSSPKVKAWLLNNLTAH